MRTIRCCILPALLLTTAIAATSGCVDTDDAVTTEAETVSGDLIATVDLDGDHQVRFYELEPGVVAIRESASLDVPYRAIDFASLRGASLARVYESIAPADEVDALVVARLDEADRLAKVQRAVMRSADLPDPSDPMRLPGDGGPTAVASADLFGDNWGADWFLDRYCVEGGFRFCPTNVAWAQSGTIDDDWYKTCLMTADFEQGAWFQGQHHSWWQWHDDFTFHMRPRRVECWYYGSSGKRRSWSNGDGPNQRIHFSALH